MTRIGWKLFTVGVLAMEGSELLSVSRGLVVRGLTDIPAILGLIGYSWSVAIGRRWIWKAVFCLEAIELSLASLLFPMLWRSRPHWPSFFVWAIAFGTGMSLAKLYALYRYAFGKSERWDAAQTAAAALS